MESNTSVNEQPVAKILDLPSELLVNVASHLSTVRLGYFRRTCKTIERALFDSFAREFFTKRQFSIEEVSLQTLIDISKHDVLSRRLSEVIISLERFSSAAAHPNAEAVYHQLYGQALIDTGRARDMLVEAFSNLPNVRIIGLRDYNARGRLREGDMAVWKSYGWTSIHPQFATMRAGSPTPQQFAVRNHIDLSLRGYNEHSPATVLPLTMFALGRANVRLDSIEVFLRKQCLTPDTLKVLQDGFLSGTVKPLVSGLKKVMLTLGLERDSGHGAPHLPTTDFDPIDAPLKHFLHKTTNIDTLRLNFQTQQYYCNPILEWLGRKSISQSRADPLVHPPVLANLTTLEIGMAQVTAPTLLNLLCKVGGRLHTLSLWRIALLHRNDVTDPNSPEMWPALLQAFANSLPNNSPLQKIMIGHAQEQGRPGKNEIHHASFRLDEGIVTAAGLTSYNVTETVLFKASLTHTSVKDWLKDIVERFMLPNRDEMHDSEDDEVYDLDDEESESEFDEEDWEEHLEDAYDSDLEDGHNSELDGRAEGDDLSSEQFSNIGYHYCVGEGPELT